MSTDTSVRKRLAKRLLPLYIAVFAHGFVLFYAIEKIFMHTIGFNDAGIGIMVAAYSALMLIAQTPSGILADRWSRKGVLMIASVCLILSTIIGGISTEPLMYIVCALFWGLFYAFYLGTYDSVVYDTVIEETGDSQLYEKYYGRVQILDSVALILSALLAAVISEWMGLRATFFWTIPFSLAAPIALLFFREPTLHKAHDHGTVLAQFKDTFKQVLGRRTLFRLLAVIVLCVLLADILYEFATLWAIALDAPDGWYGPMFAAVLSSIAIGGFIAGRIEGVNRRGVIVGSLLTVLGSALALAVVPNLFVILAAQVAMGAALTLLGILFNRDLHESLPSHIRAGASSTVNTLARGIIIPFALGFGVLSSGFNIFIAAWMVVITALITLLLEIRPHKVIAAEPTA
jgi:MFS family permease